MRILARSHGDSTITSTLCAKLAFVLSIIYIRIVDADFTKTIFSNAGISKLETTHLPIDTTLSPSQSESNLSRNPEIAPNGNQRNNFRVNISPRHFFEYWAKTWSAANSRIFFFFFKDEVNFAATKERKRKKGLAGKTKLKDNEISFASSGWKRWRKTIVFVICHNYRTLVYYFRFVDSQIIRFTTNFSLFIYFRY